MADLEHIRKNDSTASFGKTFLTINLRHCGEEVDVPISKAVVKVGPLPPFVFNNPEFPLKINLTPSQTACLAPQNTVYMAVYDEYGRKQTCDGCLKFIAKNRVV